MWGREIKYFTIETFESIYEEKYSLQPAFEKTGQRVYRKKIEKYKAMKRASRDTDILIWWKIYENRFPTLAKMAKGYLRIQATSVAGESPFSVAGLISHTKCRSILNEVLNKSLLCMKSLCRSGIKTIVMIK